MAYEKENLLKALEAYITSVVGSSQEKTAYTAERKKSFVRKPYDPDSPWMSPEQKDFIRKAMNDLPTLESALLFKFGVDAYWKIKKDRYDEVKRFIADFIQKST